MAIPRSDDPSGSLRGTLLNAALALLRERNGEAFTLRELALRVGVPPEAPSAYFVDKFALLAAMAATGFRDLAAVLGIASMDAADAHGRLLETGAAYVRFGCAHAALYRLMFSDRETADHRGEPELAPASRDAFRVLTDALSDLRYERRVRPGNPLADAAVVWASMHGIVMLTIDGHAARVPNLPPPQALARQSMAAFIDGIVER